jgi:hypothetical protein
MEESATARPAVSPSIVVSIKRSFRGVAAYAIVDSMGRLRRPV